MMNDHVKLKTALADLALLAEQEDCPFVAHMAMLMVHFLSLSPVKQTLLLYMIQNLCDLVEANGIKRI